MTPLALITSKKKYYLTKPELKEGTKVETKQIITFKSSFTLIFTL